MHFVSFYYIEESVTEPGKYYRNNVSASIAQIEMMVEKKISNFIFPSSCATCGEPVEIPITELYSQNPISPCGRSKLMVEQILLDFRKAYEVLIGSSEKAAR
jgi:UDP-glucose 4-epimerase